MAPRLDRKFERLIDYMVEQQKQSAEAVQKQSAGRPWLNFSTAPLPSDQQAASKEEAELRKVFDREPVNKSYIDARSKEDSTSNEVAVAKIAGDYMATCERDRRGRQRSRIRMMAHSAARTAGFGQKNGPLQCHTVSYLQRIFLKPRDNEVEV